PSPTSRASQPSLPSRPACRLGVLVSSSSKSCPELVTWLRFAGRENQARPFLSGEKAWHGHVNLKTDKATLWNLTHQREYSLHFRLSGFCARPSVQAMANGSAC